MISRILNSEEDFQSLKKMLIQDAEINRVEAFFDDNEPMEYPCLAKVNEIDNVHIDLNIDGDEDIEEMIEQQLEDGVEMGSAFLYDFMFITQREIKELLDA